MQLAYRQYIVFWFGSHGGLIANFAGVKIEWSVVKPVFCAGQDTLYSLSASLHPVVWMSTSKINAGDWPLSGLESHAEGSMSIHYQSYFMLKNPQWGLP